jgi:signal peptidase II
MKKVCSPNHSLNDHTCISAGYVWKKWPWFFLALIVIVLDQASKYLASIVLLPYQPEAVIPMFNFTLAYNTGAAFSFLSRAGEWHRWVFVVFSLIMSIALSIAILRSVPAKRLQLLALGLILGGAIGNLIDRAFLGYVIDFIDIYYKDHHWPVFNIADSAICVGAFLLFIDLVRSESSD